MAVQNSQIDPWPAFEHGIPVFDLHRYTVLSADELSGICVREAWEHGYPAVRLIHGSPYSRHHFDIVAARGGAGIKWMLRGALYGGGFEPYARGPRSRKHIRGPGALTIALRPNPLSDESGPWSTAPERDYEAGGRHPWRV